MLWIYQKLYPENLRELTLVKAHCANTVRHLMTDKRSTHAIDVAIAFGEGRATREELNTAADAAYAAYAAATACATAAYAAYATATATADAATANAYADAAAYAAANARTENQKQTADICRKYLKLEID
jgi:hypothetical protein